MAQMALQLAQNSPPGMFNLEALNRTILNSANMPNIEEILPPKQQAQKLDPVSDIMAATKGLPIAAFPGQDHEAHIQVKMAYLQDPANGANPIMQRIAPDVTFGVAHGGLKESKLEETILQFIEQRFQVLICTTIIESGIDMPNVNTLIVNQADRFGLSQLYQIRGRVGRSSTQAYAFLLVDSFKPNDTSRKRQVCQHYADFAALAYGTRGSYSVFRPALPTRLT